MDENLVIFDASFDCDPVGEPVTVELSQLEMQRRDGGYTQEGFPVLIPDIGLEPSSASFR